MEKTNERVLAYTLAKELGNDELSEVSGGSSKMTTRQTVRATGGSGQGVDVFYDVTVDW